MSVFEKSVLDYVLCGVSIDMLILSKLFHHQTFFHLFFFVVVNFDISWGRASV